MKKSLSITIIMCLISVASIINAQDVTSSATWIKSLNTGNFSLTGTDLRCMAYANSKLYFGDRIGTATTSAKKIQVYNTTTGDFIKTVTLPDINDAYGNNTIRTDAAGNLILMNLALDARTTPFHVWKMANEDATPTLIIDYTDPSATKAVRIDFGSIYGDVNGEGYILASISTSGTVTDQDKTILKWNINSGVVSSTPEKIILQSYSPAAVTSNGGYAQIYPVNATQFYVDGATTYPTLYNTNGTIADGFSNAPAGITKPITNANGIATVKLGTTDFLICGANTETALATKNCFYLYKMGDGGTFAGMTLVETLPIIGFGTVVNGSAVVLPIIEKVNESKANIYLYAYKNGYAKYELNLNNYRSKATGDWTITSTWESSGDNSTWSNATSAPNSSAPIIDIIANHEIIVSTNATAGILNINPQAKLTINSTNNLNINTLNIKSDITGTGTLVENGTSTIINSNVQQYLTVGRNWYLSSPVGAASVSTINTVTGSTIVSYDEVNGTSAPWITESSSLTPSKGYIVVSPVNTEPTITFSGTLNTGSQSIGLTRTAGQTMEGFNLVGNPYPSYVNWESATKTNLLSTMWYRSKNAGNTAYVFDTYNATGSIGTSNNGTTVTSEIPPMQAFWVRVTTGTGTLAFDNTMRSHEVGTNRLKAPAVATQQVLRLQVSNGINSDEAIVLFDSNASDGYDAFDSPKMTNNNPAVPEIYTTAEVENLVINGLNSLTTNRELPLVFSTGASNTFTIKSTEVSNFDSDTRIILIDKLLNLEQDITDGTAYSFISDVANTNSRFSILFRSLAIATGMDKNSSNNPDIMIFKNANNQITVNCVGDNFKEGMISIYSTLGQILMNTHTTGSNTVIGKSFVPGVYFVTVTVTGKSFTKKLIIN